jgi:hypothetical protein
MYCSKCGASNLEGASFCGHCGAPLQVVPPDSVSPPTGQAQVSKTIENAGTSGSTRSGSRRNLAVIAIVVVVACAIVAAVVILGLGNGNGDLSGIRNGEYMSYNVTATMSGQTMTGTMRMDVSNVTSSTMTVKYTITIAGRSTSEEATLNYSGDSWSTAQVGTPGGSNTTYIGQESMSTVYGTMTVYHYSEQYSGYAYEFWSGSNGCPYKIVYAYTSGMIVTCMLHDTNIKDFKS